MNKKELLTEITGVPKAINFWIEQLSTIIADLTEELVEENSFNEVNVEYLTLTEPKEIKKGIALMDGYNVSGEYINKKVIKNSGVGNEKGLLQDPRFQSYPLYAPKISLDVKFIPDEFYDIEFKRPYDGIEGEHGFDSGSKMISNIEGVKIFILQEFEFVLYLPMRYLKNFNKNTIKSIIKPTINHELVHAYELYRKLETKEDPFQGQETFLNVIKKVLPDTNLKMVNKFMHLIYLHLYFEINARVSQLYQEMVEDGVTRKEEFFEAVKKSSIWGEFKKLESFNADEYLSYLVTNFGDQKVKNFIKKWDSSLQTINTIFKEQGIYKGKFMDLVPKEAKENPKVFFKFFEKRFHNKAAEFKRKILRLYNLVVNKPFVNENKQVVCPSCSHDWTTEVNDENPYLCHMCGYDVKDKKYKQKEMNQFWDKELQEKWSKKYKKSINCSNPKGFSQKAHCAARRKRKAGQKTKSKSPFN
jgi:hypothetical protein